MIRPEDLPVTDGLPELLRFENGQEVRTPADWAWARSLVAWSLSGDPETGGTLLNISVSAGGRSASFEVLAGLPSREAPKDGFPFWLEYWPWHFQNWFTKEWFTGFSPNSRRAMERGYAAFQYDWSRVAQDNDSFTDNSGTLVKITLDIPATMEAGEYTVKVLNAELMEKILR